MTWLDGWLPSAQETGWVRAGAGLPPLNMGLVTHLEPSAASCPQVQWASALPTSKPREAPTPA